jgi:hypothetical protein
LKKLGKAVRFYSEIKGNSPVTGFPADEEIAAEKGSGNVYKNNVQKSGRNSTVRSEL